MADRRGEPVPREKENVAQCCRIITKVTILSLKYSICISYILVISFKYFFNFVNFRRKCIMNFLKLYKKNIIVLLSGLMAMLYDVEML